MEIAGVVSRPVMPFYCAGAGGDTQISRSFSIGLSVYASKKNSVNLISEVGNSGFRDSRHLENYESARVGRKEKKEKGKISETKTVKNKRKLIEKLTRSLSTYSHMASAVDPDISPIDGVEGKMITELMEPLLAHLQLMEAEEKERKRKKKEEKAQLKAKAKCKSESSSSSSSESSDSECGEVIDMKHSRNTTSLRHLIDIRPQESIQEAKLAECSSHIDETKSDEIVGNEESSLEQRIEVCMGGKCKKLGAMALMEEFQREVGGEGAVVVGCKCMGKCKTAPNVKLSSQVNGIQDENVKVAVSPLCIGVGLEDVGEIVANLLGKYSRKDEGLMAPA